MVHLRSHGNLEKCIKNTFPFRLFEINVDLLAPHGNISCRSRSSDTRPSPSPNANIYNQCPLQPPSSVQYPEAPGAFSSFRKSISNSLNFSFPPPAAPPFAPFPLRSTSLATRSQLVPPALVSCRLSRNSPASVRVRVMDFSFFVL